MGLITCPECGREGVSALAEACPGCGYPLPAPLARAETPDDETRRALWAGLLTGAAVRVRDGKRKVAAGSLIARTDALLVDTRTGRVPLCALDEVQGIDARGPRVYLNLGERTLTIRFVTHLSKELARRKSALADLVGQRLPAARADRAPRRGLAFVLVVAIAIGAVSLWNQIQRRGNVSPVPSVVSPDEEREPRVARPEVERRAIYARAEALRARARTETTQDEERYAREDLYLNELATERGLSRAELDAIVREGQRQLWPSR